MEESELVRLMKTQTNAELRAALKQLKEKVPIEYARHTEKLIKAILADRSRVN